MNPQFKQRGGLGFGLLAWTLVIIVLIVLTAYFFYGLEPVMSAEPSLIQFKIVKGDGFKFISARLSQESLIKSVSVFKLYALFTGNAQKFQPGVYELTPSMSVPQIVSAFVSGGKNEIVVTVPEGSTVKDIDAILAENEVIKNGDLVRLNDTIESLKKTYAFLSSATNLEGFLFPDTYRFERNSTIGQITDAFLKNFERKAWPLLQEKKQWEDTLILASFLEREVITFEDRQLVAGIILKRIALDIPLQVDATISYAKCEGKTRNCAQLQINRTDTKISSPYNTYERLGFTPTPIANPGQASIKAALTPRASSYLYYLSARETKETMFSKTLEEHNEKRAKYL